MLSYVTRAPNPRPLAKGDRVILHDQRARTLSAALDAAYLAVSDRLRSSCQTKIGVWMTIPEKHTAGFAPPPLRTEIDPQELLSGVEFLGGAAT